MAGLAGGPATLKDAECSIVGSAMANPPSFAGKGKSHNGTFTIT